MLPNRSMPPGTVIPVVPYLDVRVAANWLCHAFGFAERLRIGDHRIQLTVGDASIVVVAQPAAGSSTPPVSASGPCTTVMVRIPNADSHAAHAARCGARIVSPPTEYPYGERQYTVEDLAGHRWTFSETVADVDPATWGGQLLE